MADNQEKRWSSMAGSEGHEALAVNAS